MRVIFLLIAFLFIYQLFLKSALAVSIDLSNPTSDGDGTTLDVTITGLAQTSCPNIKCFLQGMYTKSTANKYFGFTQSNDQNWYLYDGTPDPQVIREVFFNFTPQEGSWSGKIKVRPDYSDTDYTGPGDYVIRVRRYTGNTDGPTNEKSNDVTVSLNYATATPTPSPSPEPVVRTTSSTASLTQSSTSRSSSTSSVTSTTSISKTPTPTPPPKVATSSSSSSLMNFAGLEIDTHDSSDEAVLAEETDSIIASPSQEIKVLMTTNRIPILLAGLSLFSISSLLLIMRYLRLIR